MPGAEPPTGEHAGGDGVLGPKVTGERLGSAIERRVSVLVRWTPDHAGCLCTGAQRSAVRSVGRVVASPYCRTRQTARLAFGRASPSPDLISARSLASRAAREGQPARLRRLPGQNPQPYAVYVDAADLVWLTDFGANALVRFDPVRERFVSFPLRSPGANVRQLLGRPGEVWGAESGAIG